MLALSDIYEQLHFIRYILVCKVWHRTFHLTTVYHCRQWNCDRHIV